MVQWRKVLWCFFPMFARIVCGRNASDQAVLFPERLKDATMRMRDFRQLSVPIGNEFRVNTYTTSHQYSPAVAGLSGGGFVITWSSSGQDGSGHGIYAQRYGSSGAAQGSEFQVNTYTDSTQGSPAVAGLSGGGFVITWRSSGQDGSGEGIYAQRYDSSGVARGSEFRVNTYTTSHQWYPAVAGLSGGGFVITWQSDGQDGSGVGIYAQRYDSSGVAQGSEFRVNTYTTSSQEYPAVAGLSGGGFVITWQSDEQDGSYYGIYAQRYDSSGVAQGSEFRVNTYTTSEQRYPAVAGLSGGGFVITWQSLSQDGSSYGIYAQRYDSFGVAQGSEFQVNTYTTNGQWYPAVAGLSGGGFVITWRSYEQDGSDWGIYAQRYDSSGVAQGSEFQVNTYTTSSQEYPAVAGLSGGEFVITWMSSGQDGSDYGIYAQLFMEPTDAPTSLPASLPSMVPTSIPSHLPTSQPSSVPTCLPTSAPTTSPPSMVPSSMPSLMPTSLPSSVPTTQPTSIPTAQPSLVPTSRPSVYPTNSPTSAPSSVFACSAYSAINTNSAQQNTVPCSFYACPNQVITISTCGTCSGDTYLRLFDVSGTELTRGDDNCASGGLCTYFTYTISSTASCQYVTVRQGCHGGSSCSGTTSVTISGAGLTSPPTFLPTKSPTVHPTIAPSAEPSRSPTHKPTAHQTLVPTRHPTTTPTEAPSQQPSRSPTHKPTAHPTLVPTQYPTTTPTEAPSQQPSRSPTNKPTTYPSHIPTPQPPTPSPSPPPTLSPTVPPASSIPHLASVQCKNFEASYTASARRSTVSCFFLACQHDTIEVSMCNTCVDDAMMRIYDANGVEIGNSDDSCGACPKWFGSRNETSCAVYEIRQGCYNDLSCSGTTTVTISSHCATGWLEYSGSCYAFNYAARDYASASTVCSDADARVVSINSKEEANWLFGQNNWDSAYVGYVNHDGVWKWEDGTSKYENWATEEPNGGESKCAIMVNDGEMYDTNCDDKYPFFCEYSCAYCASSLSDSNNNKPHSDYSTFEVVILAIGVFFGVVGCAALVYHVRHKAQGRGDPDFSGIVMVEPPQPSVNVVPTPSAPLAPENDPAFAKAQQDNLRITVKIPDPPSNDNV